MLYMNKTHGMRRTRFYRIWVGLKTRCTNKNHTWYKHYGGKGITFPDKWFKFEGFLEDMFESYLEHVQEYGISNTSLDRIDGNASYSKENCKWATKVEQSRNSASNRYVEVNGKKRLLAELADESGIAYGTLYARVFRYGIPIEKALIKEDRRKYNGRN